MFKHFPDAAVTGYPFSFSFNAFFSLWSLFDFNFSDGLTCECPVLTIKLTIFSAVFNFRLRL